MTLAERHDDYEQTPAATTLAAEVADQILTRLAGRPELLDAIADRLADRLADRFAGPPAQPTSPATAPVEDQPAMITEASHTTVRELLDWVMTHHPHLVSGDPELWAADLVAAAGDRTAQPMLRWAMSADCASTYWINRKKPLLPPRAGRSKRHGDCAQLIVEYRASAEHPDVCALIEQVIEGIRGQITRFGVHQFTQDAGRSRRAAADLLRTHDWNSAQVVDIVAWGLANKPHWRSNVKAVPTAATFTKIRGDWISAGRPSLSSLAAVEAPDVKVIADGWAYHYGRLHKYEHVPVTETSRRRIAECLSGGDGADALTVDQIKQFVLWLCDSTNRHTQYLVSGVDFPSIANVRRGLTAMRTLDKKSAVTTTNDVASGQVRATIDVSEV